MDIQHTGEAVRKALEFNHPLQQMSMKGRGELDELKLLQGEARGIIISSVRYSQNTLFIRAFEPMGVKLETDLKFNMPISSVYKLSNGVEQPSEISLEKDGFSDVFEAYEIAYYKVEF